jgi:NOL1/NOP2/fmu family ribosome biogenesis protein|tara:strand:+ start:14213 stop:14659 length:447 start_codon:yes stop_codon:yes gene_type:complete
MKILKSTQKKKIINQLNEQYGISKLPYLLLQFGKDKIRLYSGNLSVEELNILDVNLRIENIGLYFAKQQVDGIRLTLDGVQLLKEQINKNILKINNKQASDWLKGNDLSIKSDSAFKILQHNNEFLGCGKSTGERITNSIPKERRIKG